MMKTQSHNPLVAATLTISSLLAACASTPTESEQAMTAASQEASATVPPDPESAVKLAQTDVRCVRQKKTGTHMFTKVCTTAEQRKKMQEESQALANKVRRSHDLSVSNAGRVGQGPAAK